MIILLAISFILSCKKEETPDSEKENKPPVVEILSPIGNVIINVGDTVKIMETRPLSKLKRWRLVEIIERVK